MKKWIVLLISLLLVVLSILTVVAEPVELTDLRIQMTLTQENGVIVASLIDHRGGTVSSWPVSLEIDGETVATVNTDASGDAIFEYDIPAGSSQVACTAHDGEYDVYRFVGCTMYLENFQSDPTTTTSASSDESEATSTSADESTATTTQSGVDILQMGQISSGDTLAVSPLTTTINATRVGIGVDADKQFLNACDLTASDLTSKARMWMDKTVYDALVSTSSSTLHLQLTLNPQAGTTEKLIAAKNANTAYASYSDEQVKGLAVDMQVAYVDDSNRVPLEIEDGMYEIELPLPTTMKNCDKVAVSVCSSSGLTDFIEVKPVGGVLKFTIQRFQTLAIVGFGEHAVAIGSLSETPWALTLIVIVGVLLIVGGIALLAFVAFRRAKSNAAVKEDTEPSNAVLPIADNSSETEDNTDAETDDRSATVVFEQNTATDAKHFRSKDSIRSVAFSSFDVHSVSPAGQISNKKLDAVLNEAATVDDTEATTVDDMIDDLLSDIDDLDAE